MSRDHLVSHPAASTHEHEPAAQVVDFLRDNGRNLAIGAAVIVAAVVGTVLYRNSATGSDKVASAQVAQAYDRLVKGQNDQASAALNDVIRKYGSTPSGNQARLLLGNLELGQGNAAAAQTQFSAFLGHASASDYLWSGGQRGLAAALENQGKPAEAAAAYEKLLQAPLGDEERARALLDAARAWGDAGSRDKGIAACDRIIKEFGTSKSVANAKLLKAELGGK